MKKTLIIALGMLLAFGGNALAQDKQNKKKNNKQEVLFDVPMTCQSCKKKIEKNIAFEKGVSDMAVNLEDKTVKVVYQSGKTDEQKLQKAFSKLGYEATVHKQADNQ